MIFREPITDVDRCTIKFLNMRSVFSLCNLMLTIDIICRLKTTGLHIWKSFLWGCSNLSFIFCKLISVLPVWTTSLPCSFFLCVVFWPWWLWVTFEGVKCEVQNDLFWAAHTGDMSVATFSCRKNLELIALSFCSAVQGLISANQWSLFCLCIFDLVAFLNLTQLLAWYKADSWHSPDHRAGRDLATFTQIHYN